MSLLHVFILFVITETGTASFFTFGLPEKCSELALQKINYQLLAQLSPFVIFRSTEGIYNCSQNVYTTYVGDRNCYTGQVLVYTSDNIHSYDVTVEDGNVFRATLCRDGSRGNYRVIYSRINGMTTSFFCVVICDQSGNSIETLVCPGRTYKDEMAIDNYLRNELKVKISRPVFNSQEGCKKQQYCESY